MTAREELLALIQAHHLDEPRYRWRQRLAALCGVSVPTVHGWLRTEADAGRKDPDPRAVALLRERLSR